ncbi:MAG TPA: hypothetical protein VK203_18380 [Nostocaceae cyanobacterium]|nr:hypothetical protein [Nostocaceae cyanobacterium]
MSSGSSSRYQSKLFNFVFQQSRRLTEQWENSFRHFQVAAKWSLETLLYSFSQLFQPDEWEGKRLQPTATASPTPVLPPSDAPIQQVLEVVQNLPSDAAAKADLSVNPFAWLGSLWLKFVNKEPEPLPPESRLQYHIPEVRAIASQLSNRGLVLVTTDNRILDVLTTQQQVTLTNKITKLIGEYGHLVKLAQIEQEKKLLPEINQIFHKLTGNDSQIATLPESQITFKSKSFNSSYQFLEFIDTFLAKLETSTIVPVQQRSQEIIHQAQTQLNIFLYGKEQVAARGQIQINSEKLESQQPSISELLEAAINYFFGFKSRGNSTTKLKPSQTTTNILPKSSNLPQSNFTPDVWLTWDDLFGNAKSNTNTNQLPPVEETQHQEINQEINIYQEEVENLPKPTSSQILTWLTQLIAGKTVANSRTQQNSATSQEDKNNIPQLEAKPEWIETSAKFVGYEKHPLEQILAWLDVLFLRLEQIFINFVYFLKGLFSVNR